MLPGCRFSSECSCCLHLFWAWVWQQLDTSRNFFRGWGMGCFFCGLTDLLVGDALVMVPHGLAANLLLAPAPAYPPMCSYLLWYYLWIITCSWQSSYFFRLSLWIGKSFGARTVMLSCYRLPQDWKYNHWFAHWFSGIVTVPYVVAGITCFMLTENSGVFSRRRFIADLVCHLPSWW